LNLVISRCCFTKICIAHSESLFCDVLVSRRRRVCLGSLLGLNISILSTYSKDSKINNTCFRKNYENLSPDSNLSQIVVIDREISSFHYMLQVVFPIYLDDLYEGATDVHRVHVSCTVISLTLILPVVLLVFVVVVVVVVRHYF